MVAAVFALAVRDVVVLAATFRVVRFFAAAVFLTVVFFALLTVVLRLAPAVLRLAPAVLRLAAAVLVLAVAFFFAVVAFALLVAALLLVAATFVLAVRGEAFLAATFLVVRLLAAVVFLATVFFALLAAVFLLLAAAFALVVRAAVAFATAFFTTRLAAFLAGRFAAAFLGAAERTLRLAGLLFFAREVVLDAAFLAGAVFRFDAVVFATPVRACLVLAALVGVFLLRLVGVDFFVLEVVLERFVGIGFIRAEDGRRAN